MSSFTRCGTHMCVAKHQALPSLVIPAEPPSGRMISSRSSTHPDRSTASATMACVPSGYVAVVSCTCLVDEVYFQVHGLGGRHACTVPCHATWYVHTSMANHTSSSPTHADGTSAAGQGFPGRVQHCRRNRRLLQGSRSQRACVLGGLDSCFGSTHPFVIVYFKMQGHTCTLDACACCVKNRVNGLQTALCKRGGARGRSSSSSS